MQPTSNLLSPRRVAAAAGALALAVAVAAGAQPAEPAWKNFSDDGLIAYIDMMRSSGRVPAIAVAIVQRDEGILYVGGFGARPDGAEVTAETPFPLGDAAHPLLATAALRLVKEGALQKPPSEIARADVAALSEQLTAATGQPLAEALAAQLTEPLKMPAEGPPIQGHQYLFGYPRPMPDLDPGVSASAAGLARVLLVQLRAGVAPKPPEAEEADPKKGAKRGRRGRKGAKERPEAPQEDETLRDLPTLLAPDMFQLLHASEGRWEADGDGRLWLKGPRRGSGAALVMAPESGLAVAVVSNINSLNAYTPAAVAGGLLELLKTRNTTALPFVEFYLRVALGLVLVLVVLGMLRRFAHWHRAGHPRTFDVGAQPAALAAFVVAPLVVLGAVLALASPAELVATQPDIALAVFLGCPVAVLGGLMRHWAFVRQKEIMDTFDTGDAV